MDKSLLGRIRRAHVCAVVLMGLGGCGMEEDALSGALEDTLAIAPGAEGVDTFAAQSADSIIVQLPAAEPGAAGTLLPPGTAPAAPTMSGVAPPAPQRPVGRPPAAASQLESEATVAGRVEVEIDPRTFVPADYLLVRIQSPGHRAEAWTSREGEFYFVKVPSGTYTLEVLLSPKELRPVYSRQFDLGAGQELRVPSVHIPVAAMKGGAR